MNIDIYSSINESINESDNEINESFTINSSESSPKFDFDAHVTAQSEAHYHANTTAICKMSNHTDMNLYIDYYMMYYRIEYTKHYNSLYKKYSNKK